MIIMGRRVGANKNVHTRVAEKRPRRVALQKKSKRHVMDNPASVDQRADPTIEGSANASEEMPGNPNLLETQECRWRKGSLGTQICWRRGKG